ncbi:hypothetical protein QYF61_027393 [Mycteria americana]|uniref:Uncharacterized protein n=1 Tax=Mycteria americana TaxID=33587 RepID=A0AAN7NFK4_MYCAM|nr:hypothetical protein QYF61_027393 [Mycteria americana]
MEPTVSPITTCAQPYPGPLAETYAMGHAKPQQRTAQQAAHEPVHGSMASKSREVIFPPTQQFHITSRYCIQFEIFQYKTDVDQLKQVQQRAKMVGGWSTCPVRRG